MKKPLLSIGMIFKNEVRCLERCMKSLEPLRQMIPCELVMADTGSTDGSREIAERYADILIDFPWINDFAAARNAVMEQCSGEWYLTLDCDEWLGGVIEELAVFLKTKKDYNYGSLTIRNYTSDNIGPSGNYADFDTIRLIRMSTGTVYIGTIHEHLKIPKGMELRTMLLQKVFLHHDGYAAEAWVMNDKRKRNIEPLKKELEQNPEDLILMLQYIESGGEEPDFMERLQYAIAMVKEKVDGWDRVGPAIFRSAVVVAAQRGLPELDDWIAEAKQWFPDSMFTRIDVGYFAFGSCWNREEFEECVRWGEDYVRAVDAYEVRNYDIGSTAYSSILTASAYRQQSVRVLLAGAYIHTGQMDMALKHLKRVNGEAFDGKRTEDFVRICVRLYSCSMTDAASVCANVWAQINRHESDSENCRQRFLMRAAGAFSFEYREAETQKPDFCRHAYTMFRNIPDCPLSNAVAVLDTDNADELTDLLSKIDVWFEFPACVLEHALLCGAQFPLKSFPMEEMDRLAAYLAKEAVAPLNIVEMALNADLTNLSALNWARAITLIAVRIQNWKDVEAGISISRAFVKMERIFLSFCYTADVLKENNLFMLPPMHRFGFFCVQAFDALDVGDAVGFVRLLREGLSVNESMKAMVEFLLEYTPELQEPEPPAELLSLAEQIRTVLANFSPEDPAVAALKQSEAYQKVAYLIEGVPAAAWGGLTQ